MKKNNLILGTFLAITAILFSSFEDSSFSVVTIGGQVWTSKNLDVATYRNGDVIPQVQDASAWANLKSGAWCYYDNVTFNGTKHGKLYNWYAVNDPRGLAPNGYHIPTEAEWKKLYEYLGGEEAAGTQMKSTSEWHNYGVYGNGTNSSGFSGLPGGYRSRLGSFYYYGLKGVWWSSTESRIPANGNYCELSYDDGRVHSSGSHKNNGFFVRCIRD